MNTRTLLRAAQAAILVTAAALSTGCAASNYDFDRVTEARGSARAAALLDDLAAERETVDDDALFDVTYVPLVHLDVNAFAASDGEDDYPPGHVDIDVEAYLPLAMIVDATIDRYDEDLELYEHQDVFALLWGLFATHREEIATPHGLRTTSNYRLLWFVGWGSGPKYVDA